MSESGTQVGERNEVAHLGAVRMQAKRANFSSLLT